MTLLKRLSTRPLSNPGAGWVIAFLVVALIGFADAAYLTVEHYQNVIPPCTTSGCETVLTSAYSTLFGLPVSLWGVIYYLVIAIGAIIYVEARFVSKQVRPIHEKLIALTLRATVAGLIASAYFFYLQAAVIHSFCQYCLGSAATSTILFVLAVCMLARYTSHELN